MNEIDITNSCSKDKALTTVNVLKDLFVICLQNGRNVAEVTWSYENGMSITAEVVFRVEGVKDDKG